MDGSWVCYEQLRVWSNFNTLWLDSSHRPPIFREIGKLPQILPKIWRCPHLASCRKQTAQRKKTEKIYILPKKDNRATFRWKIRKSLFTHFWGTAADALGAPSGLPLAMKYHAIVELKFCVPLDKKRSFRIRSSLATGVSVAEWSAWWTQAQKDPGLNRSRDAVG